MKKRIIAILVTMGLSVTTFVGCGSKKSSLSVDGKTKITFWHSMGGKGGEAIKYLTNEFNKSQNEIEVTAEYQGSYDDAINKLKSSALSSLGPDVMQLYDIGTKWMIDSEYIVPMQNLIDDNNYDISKFEKNIIDYYTVNNKLYSMPFNTSTPILYYNKDVFKEAGIKVPPKNFDEIINYSKKLVKKKGSKVERYGYSMPIYGWFFEQFLSKQGLNYANEGNGRNGNATNVVFNSNLGGEKIMKGWKKLIDSGVVGNFGRNYDDTINAFTAGKSVMIVGSTASLTDIKKKINGNFEIGTAYFPSVNNDDKGGVSVGGGSLWIMNHGNKNKEKAAFEFIKFMVSKESQAYWAKNTGYFSVTTEGYKSDKMAKYLEENPEFKTAIEQLRKSKNSSGALLGIFPEARASIEENIEKLLNGEINEREAINNASKTIDSALEKYNK